MQNEFTVEAKVTSINNNYSIEYNMYIVFIRGMRFAQSCLFQRVTKRRRTKKKCCCFHHLLIWYECASIDNYISFFLLLML